MSKVSRNKLNRNNNKKPLTMVIVCILCLILIGYIYFINDSKETYNDLSSSLSSTFTTTFGVTTTASKVEYDTSSECINLPQIRPASGVFFRKPEIKKVQSHDDVKPSFYFGVNPMFNKNPERVKYHMTGDIIYFELIRDSLAKLISTPSHGITLDIGANQGFYLWYLASLGYPVHAFEIQSSNFDALQAAILYNPKSVSDNALLYPIGLSSSIGYVGQSKGGSYESFITSNNPDTGTIPTATIDCWCQHIQPKLPISFIKLDVEGFEIAVLQGAKQSLLKTPGSIYTMFMEVAPDRWNRASITIQQGIDEMTYLQSMFQHAYLVVRGDKECPTELGNEIIKNTMPRRILVKDKVVMVPMLSSDIPAVINAMNTKHSSCNFWYDNIP